MAFYSLISILEKQSTISNIISSHTIDIYIETNNILNNKIYFCQLKIILEITFLSDECFQPSDVALQTWNLIKNIGFLSTSSLVTTRGIDMPIIDHHGWWLEKRIHHHRIVSMLTLMLRIAATSFENKLYHLKKSN